MPVANADDRRRRLVLLRSAPAVARPRQRLGKFRLQHRLDKSAHARPDSVLDRVEPIIEKQRLGGSSRSLVVSLIMAWSPFQRANAGIIGVEQPGDYANPIPTTSATGPRRLPIVFRWLGFSEWAETLADILRWPVVLLIVMIGLSIVYRVGPSRSKARWRWVTWGSGFAAIVLVGASMIFAWYVEKFDSYERIYGSLGAAVGFMTWIWLSVVVVLLGAELDAAIDWKGK